MFISFDGIDGAGKSTQISLLRTHLENQGVQVKCLRDPGTSKLGETIRDILLHREEIPLSMTAEMLLYMAARSQLVAEEIQPALEQGITIICDRFLLANVVYQGSAGGLPIDHLWTVGHIATNGIHPDLTIVLDLEPERAFERLQRGHDRLEKRGLEYFRRVRNGFQDQLHRTGGQAISIDALQSIEAIHQQVIAFVSAARATS